MHIYYRTEVLSPRKLKYTGMGIYSHNKTEVLSPRKLKYTGMGIYSHKKAR